MTRIDSIRGRIVLCIVQCAAMVELAVMPLWVGVLMGHYNLDAQQAGSLVAMYVIGAVISGLIIAPMFHRFRTGIYLAVGGTLVSGIAFYFVTQYNSYKEMAFLHVVGGLAIGMVLAVTEGTIGRSNQPHRLFAFTHIALNLFAASVLATMPSVIASQGGQIFYMVIAGIMILGCIASAIGFPGAQNPVDQPEEQKTTVPHPPIPTYVLAALAGLFFMSMNHAMTMSFVERVGAEKEYGLALVTTVITVMAVVKLFPAALAALLEKSVPVRAVLFVAPFLQTACAIAIFAGPSFIFYAIAAPIFIGVLNFANIFAFGLISKLDPSGRAVASTPSVMLIGTGISAFLGGTLVKYFGYSSLAIAVTIASIIALICFSRLPSLREPESQTLANEPAH